MDVLTRSNHLPDIGSTVIVVPESVYRLYGIVSDVVVDGANPNEVTIRMTLQSVPDPEPYID